MPTYDVSALAASIPPAHVAGRMGKFSLTELDLRVALALFNLYRPARVLEFGVNQGETAKCLLDHCPWIESYVGVDLRRECFPDRWGIVPEVAGAAARSDPRFEAVLTDGTEWDFHRQAVPLSPFDCILMDADHDEDPTRRDTESCSQLAGRPCLWLWHDYNVRSRANPGGPIWGVKACLDGLAARGRTIWTPDQADRDPWACCSLAWELSQA